MQNIFIFTVYLSLSLWVLNLVRFVAWRGEGEGKDSRERARIALSYPHAPLPSRARPIPHEGACAATR